MSEDRIAALARQDRDRFIAAMLAPEARRAAMFAIVAANQELARVREQVNEAMAGLIRLRWWADAFEAATPDAPLPHALHALPEWPALKPHLLALAEARARDMEDPRFGTAEAAEDYVRAVTAPLADALAVALGRADLVGLPAIADAACAHGLVGLIRATAVRARQGRNPWAAGLDDADARAALGRAVALRAETLLDGLPRLPRAAFPLVAPAALARQHLARLRRTGYEILDARLAAPSRVTLGFVARRWFGRP